MLTSETTGPVSERRLGVLREIRTRSCDVKTAEDVCRESAHALATDPADLPFSLFYLLDGAGMSARLVGISGIAASVPPIDPDLAIGGGDAAAAAFRQILEGAKAIETRPEAFVAVPPPASGRALVLPIFSGSRIVGFLVAGVNRSLAGEYRSFIDLVATLVSAAVGNVHAVDEQREQDARSEAEDANRMKDELLELLGHELRTPLNAILGWARLIRAEGIDESLKDRGLEVIDRNARLQAQLIEDLLDVSRVTAGKLRLEMRPVHLIALIDAAIQVMRPTAEAKAIAIRTVLDHGVDPVLGDADRLRQVIWNLLASAVKLTRAGGRVEIHLQQTHSHVVVTVGETGGGVEPERLPNIFERVRQGRCTSERGSLGLGLTLVKHLVELHGGTVTAHSSGRDQDAAFVVRLPVTAPVHVPAVAVQAFRSAMTVT
jgi:signal transduction histidine kinase